MTIQYVRDFYSVPAKIGGRVEWTAPNGAKFKGTIRSADHRLHVRMDGERHNRILHPTDNVKYIFGPGHLVPNKLHAGQALVAKRIDKAVKRAQSRDSKPKRPTAAQLLRKAKLEGLLK